MLDKKHIFGLGFLCLIVMSGISVAELSGSLSEEAIIERLTPDAKVKVEGGNASTKQKKGVGEPRDIYKKFCATCHKTGVNKAPILGDKGDWGARVAQGIDKLVEHAYHGLNLMPPKGTCTKCTEQDIKATVEYMVDAVK